MRVLLDAGAETSQIDFDALEPEPNPEVVELLRTRGVLPRASPQP